MVLLDFTGFYKNVLQRRTLRFFMRAALFRGANVYPLAEANVGHFCETTKNQNAI